MFMQVFESDFHDAFISANRQNNFSYAGRQALFEYFENLEEETGEAIELDVIAICCDYSEFSSVAEFANDYGGEWPEFYAELLAEHGDDEDAIREEFLERLNDHTAVIDVDGGAIIVAGF